MEYIALIISLLVGIVIGYIISGLKSQSRQSKLEERIVIKENELTGTIQKLDGESRKVLELTSELSSTRTRFEEQRQQIEELQEKFTREFENLANRIFEEKSRKFTDQNKENLNMILNPLKEKIGEFEKRVNDLYNTDTKERASLAEQIRNLHELNKQMSEEANNLTRALKGDTKAQGNWGEFILESILEKSGLVKGREYTVQETLRNEEGEMLRPDIIIKLPEEKSIVIDSKVSLNAYESYSSGENDDERKKYLNEHIASIRRHLKGLSPKDYQNLYGLQSLDFVLMFIPIEPAFALAVQNDPSLFYDAFEKNIVIVSPSTLLATLRTISSIWKQERQNKNALEIAKKSGELYDKFVGFVNDLVEVGKKLDSTKDSYTEAMKKLTEGSGNLVRRVENIKHLGAKATKSINQQILDRAAEDDSEIRLLDTDIS